MSAKLTLVVQSRRTDEADGDNRFGAWAFRLWRERSRSTGQGTGDAATGKSPCKGANGRGTNAHNSAGFKDPKR